MKNTKNLFKIMLAVVTLFCLTSSCSKDDSKTTEASPKACFTTGSLIYKPLDLIKFQNCSQNYDRVEWDFGNGGSSVLSEPTYTYSKVGTYDVTLTVFKGSSSNKITSKVFVGTNPYINISTNFTKWKNIPSNCNNIDCYYYLCSSDKSKVISDMTITGFQVSDLNLETSASAYIDVNNNADYRIKMVLQSYYYDIINDKVINVTRLDSFYTDIINVSTGPKTPNVNYKLSCADASSEISIFYR